MFRLALHPAQERRTNILSWNDEIPKEDIDVHELIKFNITDCGYL